MSMTNTQITYDTHVPTRYYRSLPELIRLSDGDADRMFAAIGLEPERLNELNGQFSAAELELLVTAVMTEGGRPDLALEMGARIHLRDHSLVGYAIASSPTIDYALRLTARFFRLIFPAFRMQYEPSGDAVVIRLTPTLAMSAECLAFHIEFVAVALHSSIEELISVPMPPDALELSIPKPSHCSSYSRVLPHTRVRFSALPSPGIRLTLSSEVLGSRPAAANAETLALIEQHCRVLQQQIIQRRHIGEWTRMMLRESSYGLPGIDELATTLNMSARTLHRHLKREGLVYRRLCVDERNRRARYFLKTTRLPLTWIAHELGYSDASNFTRAFRAGHGSSPSAFRENCDEQDVVSSDIDAERILMPAIHTGV